MLKKNSNQIFVLTQEKNLRNELKKLEKRFESAKKMPDYGDSVDDNAQEEEVFEENLGLQKNLKNLIKEIKAALKRIEKGTYGVCEGCGEKIEIGRLKAIASVAKCVTCSKKKK